VSAKTDMQCESVVDAFRPKKQIFMLPSVPVGSVPVGHTAAHEFDRPALADSDAVPSAWESDSLLRSIDDCALRFLQAHTEGFHSVGDVCVIQSPLPDPCSQKLKASGKIHGNQYEG